MATLKSCLCCSLLTGSILTGITTTVLYLMSFALELWWIVDAGRNSNYKDPGDLKEYRLPIPAYVLALAYFSMFLLSSGMLFGLRTRRTKLLLSWVLLNSLLICPEAGMVLFMSIFHWDGATEGIIEIGMWMLRVLFNVTGMICTQSLYVHWRNEKSIIRSLNDLNDPANNGMGNSYFISSGLQPEFGTKKAHQAIMHEQAIVQQQSLYQLSTDYLDRGYLPENDAQKFGYKNPGHGYQNHAYTSSSQDPLALNTMGTPSKYADINSRPLRRSASSASQLIAGLNVLDVQTDQMYHQQRPTGLSRGHGMHNGYQRNEFDTSKFTLNYNSQKLNGFASKSQLDVFTGQNFGLDPDAPLFVNYPYGPGGLPLDQGRPLSSLSSQGRRSKQRYHHFNNADSFDENNGSQLQWYRPKSLSNLDDDENRSSIWSDENSSDMDEANSDINYTSNNQTSPKNNFATQSLDRRKLSQANGFMNSYNRSQLIGQAAYRQQRNIFNEQQQRARSFSGGINLFGWSATDDGIVRGGVGPFMHYSNYGGNNGRAIIGMTGESKQSLGTQFSDHIDKYRDVAL